MQTNTKGHKKPTLLMIAGFGDNVSMFENLTNTPLADEYNLIMLDLPGFGSHKLSSHELSIPALEETSLISLAEFVSEQTERYDATAILAHSVASVIASLAASMRGTNIHTLLSLEGNLTAEDAYFSGMAADYDDAATFFDAFQNKLAKMAETDPIIARYRAEVARADVNALWELGCNAKAFTHYNHPGELLMQAAHAVYIYNPDNCAPSSLRWLQASSMERYILAGASHWPSIDRPNDLSQIILTALDR
ncbi:alpha/beta fold hydrolase [Kordiimonas sp. SCSIO 12610]|uniref:alpha/beta fold hydrolase n=1 Tax=Kordiimonas sp. SCSIO 12610 TaxID=2829597 RepID=UPI002108D455|nr:alpha/beta fold hydrolase [Kordiimonas sp. SCSIO 12610]UTW56129.1 alpha/beta fold hydrolase [Kordiimonas sp. SCSIO 12610]